MQVWPYFKGSTSWHCFLCLGLHNHIRYTYISTNHLFYLKQCPVNSVLTTGIIVEEPYSFRKRKVGSSVFLVSAQSPAHNCLFHNTRFALCSQLRDVFFQKPICAVGVMERVVAVLQMINERRKQGGCSAPRQTGMAAHSHFSTLFKPALTSGILYLLKCSHLYKNDCFYSFKSRVTICVCVLSERRRMCFNRVRVCVNVSLPLGQAEKGLVQVSTSFSRGEEAPSYPTVCLQIRHRQRP